MKPHPNLWGLLVIALGGIQLLIATLGAELFTARMSFVVTIIGVVWGTVAGFVGGRVDSVMMRIVDGLLAIPAIFWLLFLASVLKPSISTLIIVVGLGIMLAVTAGKPTITRE